MKFHSAAEAFPLIVGSEFDRLVSDIRANGLHNPITLHRDGSILDGRNRWYACRQAGVSPSFVTFPGTDAQAVAFVVSQNITRRHMDESQRAMVAAKLANLRNGEQARHASPIGEAVVTEAQAAEMLNVGKRSVERARKVREHGTPELVAAVERGEVSVSAAAAVAELPERDQRAAVAKPKKDQPKKPKRAPGELESDVAWRELWDWRNRRRNLAVFRPIFDAVDLLRPTFKGVKP